MLKEEHQELGRPIHLLLLSEEGKEHQRNGGALMGEWESDYFIVLRDGRADHMGKGVAGRRSRERKQVPDA
jgi:hypothetical protein